MTKTREAAWIAWTPPRTAPEKNKSTLSLLILDSRFQWIPGRREGCGLLRSFLSAASSLGLWSVTAERVTAVSLKIKNAVLY
jgi:hypothetical protein